MRGAIFKNEKQSIYLHRQLEPVALVRTVLRTLCIHLYLLEGSQRKQLHGHPLT